MTSVLQRPLPRARILVVEDLPSQQANLRRMLERLGYGVVTVNDGKHALDMIKTSRFDLVCMDVVLPRESGYQICEMIRDELGVEDVAIVLMNDRASPLDRAQAYEVGAQGYLLKPFSLADLREEVERVLAGPRSSGRLRASERPQ